MSENEHKKYNAFISYRHTDLDKFVAENLHKLIETYKMPKTVVEKYNITDNNIRRVFRDQEELPLSSNLENPIIQALRNSEFLIVICSPRIKESLWCRKEIENFIKFHGRSNILCVLIEGEPEDSFPEELLYYEENNKDKNGRTIIKKVPCEPLAMDVRGSNKKEVLKKMKSDIVRIMAPLYKLDYDDIKRRHEERENKRKANILKIIAIVSVIFGIYSFILFSKIYISSKELKHDQAINLANDSKELLNKDDRVGAVEKAYQSVTSYNNIKLPATSEGIYQLTDSLGVYYMDKYIYPISKLNTNGVVEYIKRELSKYYLLSYDSSGELVLWDLKKEKRIKTITDTSLYMNNDTFTFIKDKGYAYINEEKEVVIGDYKGNEIKRINKGFISVSVNVSDDGKYLEVDDYNKINIYETDKYSLVATYKVSSDMSTENNRYFDTKGENFVFGITENGFDNSNDLEILTFNIKDKKIINKLKTDSDTINKMIFNKDNLSILTKRVNGKATDMVLTNFNYKNGKINYQKEYNKEAPLTMEINLVNKDYKTILLAGDNFLYLLDYDTGKQRDMYSVNSEVVDLYTSTSNEGYFLFTKDGTLHDIIVKDKGYNKNESNIVFSNIFNCNLSNYVRFLGTKAGYLAFINNDNRIIIYNFIKNNNYKKVDYKARKYETVYTKDSRKIAKKYNKDKEYLVNKAFYSDDKKIVFIVYKDNMLEIYDTKSKKLLKSLEIPNYAAWLSNYVGKTKNGEHIIKGIGGYVLNKDFELVAYIPNLYDYKEGKIILSKDNKEYYEMNLYTQDEIIKMGKDFLKKKGLE